MHDVVLNGDVPIDLDFDRMFVDTELIDGGLWKGWLSMTYGIINWSKKNILGPIVNGSYYF